MACRSSSLRGKKGKKMSKNVIFIGFMGCGKSTIAKALAKALGAEFIDTDKLIKQRVGKDISEIFAEFGEDFFRNEERKIASEILQLQGVVIATGGGFYKALQKDKNSVIIYLKANFEFLQQRLEKKGFEKRPLFQNAKKARALYNERLAEYEKKADIIINVEHKSVRKIVDELIKDLQ